MKKFTLFLLFAVSANLFLSQGAFGQIAQRGASTNGNSTNTSLTINKPTGVVAGDVMIVNIGQRNNGTTAPTCAGWTAISSGAIDGGTTLGALLYKVAGASEPASYTFTLGAGANNNEGTIVAFSGVDVTGTPFDVAPGSLSVSGGNGSTATATGITTVSANAAVIMFAQVNDNQSMGTWSTTSPGALTELYEDQYNASGAVDLTLGAAWATKATAGATGNGTMSIGASSRWGAQLIALKAIPPTPSVSITPNTTQRIATGGTVSVTATASNFTGSGNYTYTWIAAGATIPGSNPNSIAAASDTKILTFPTSGTFTVSVTISRGATTLTTVTTTVRVFSAPANPNLWATSSDGTQISSLSVNGGVYFAGPTNIFAPTFGGPNGGTSTAALGKSATNPSNNYFYYLPNTSSNNGVIDIYGATPTGSTIAVVGTIDMNGAGNNNSLGFVRLGMGPDGRGWILAGDGTTLYLAKFVPNGTSAATVTLEDANGVTLVGGSASTFQNGDLCVSGNGNIYALANDGSGLTQIFIGAPNGNSTTLTKQWDLVDNNGAGFTGSVNGVAFDLLGSLYISTATGLFFIDQTTVNGPAGTVGCFLVQAITGLQDLASNSFPTNSLLPVQLGDFTAVKQGTNAAVKWTTFTESNCDHFEVERSYDGISFTTVGNVQAFGTTTDQKNYQFLDPITVNSGIIYYRLRTIDKDGKAAVSKIVSLRINGGSIKDFTVFPNPFSNDLKIQLSSDKQAPVQIRISNAAGQLVVSKNIMLQKGENIVVMSSELNSLKPGMHLMEIISEDGKMTQKIIKR